MARKGMARLAKGPVFDCTDEEALWFAMGAMFIAGGNSFLEEEAEARVEADFTEDELTAQALAADEFDDLDEDY